MDRRSDYGPAMSDLFDSEGGRAASRITSLYVDFSASDSGSGSEILKTAGRLNP